MWTTEDMKGWLEEQYALQIEPKKKEHANFCMQLSELEGLGELGGPLYEFVELAELRHTVYHVKEQIYIDEINRSADKYFDVFYAVFSAGATIKEVYDVLENLLNRDEHKRGEWGCPIEGMDPRVVEIPQRLLEALSKLSVGQ
jgi:hypothetical protein